MGPKVQKIPTKQGKSGGGSAAQKLIPVVLLVLMLLHGVLYMLQEKEPNHTPRKRTAEDYPLNHFDLFPSDLETNSSKVIPEMSKVNTDVVNSTETKVNNSREPSDLERSHPNVTATKVNIPYLKLNTPNLKVNRTTTNLFTPLLKTETLNSQVKPHRTATRISRKSRGQRTRSKSRTTNTLRSRASASNRNHGPTSREETPKVQVSNNQEQSPPTRTNTPITKSDETEIITNTVVNNNAKTTVSRTVEQTMISPTMVKNPYNNENKTLAIISQSVNTSASSTNHQPVTVLNTQGGKAEYPRNSNTSSTVDVTKYDLTMSKVNLTSSRSQVKFNYTMTSGSHDPWTGVPAVYEETSKGTIFRYHNIRISSAKGQPLLLSNFYKKRFDWPPRDYVTVSRETNLRRGHVIVSAISSNHMNLARGMISSVQTKAPGVKLIIYDLGLEPWEVKEISSLCDVEYRKFNFSAYPPHFLNLRNYAWKPALIAEVLREYPRVVWFDASIRFVQTGDLSHLKSQLINNGGMVQLNLAGHSIYVATHPKLYKYFPCNRGRIKETEMGGCTSMYITRSETIFKNILLFSVLCALDVHCIQPTKNTTCEKKENKNTYRNCHRFDQATYSLLLANHFGYRSRTYQDPRPKGDFIRVERKMDNPGRILRCRNTS